jgi:hypothetical protein
MSTYDPLDIKSNQRKKAYDEAREKFERESEEADFKWLMGSKRGRRIVWRLLEQAGVFRLSFNTNAMAMAFAEGNRSYGNRTLAMVHSVCPELYPTMVRENANDRHNDDDGTDGHNDH